MSDDRLTDNCLFAIIWIVLELTAITLILAILTYNTQPFQVVTCKRCNLQFEVPGAKTGIVQTPSNAIDEK